MVRFQKPVTYLVVISCLMFLVAAGVENPDKRSADAASSRSHGSRTKRSTHQYHHEHPQQQQQHHHHSSSRYPHHVPACHENHWSESPVETDISANEFNFSDENQLNSEARRGAPKFVGKRRAPYFVGKRGFPKHTKEFDFSGENQLNSEERRAAPKFVGRRGAPFFVGKRGLLRLLERQAVTL